MTANLSTAQRFYAAFAARDAAAMMAALHDDFVGYVSAGMPLGVGGRHPGGKPMLAEVWARIAGAYDVAPVPDELLECGSGRLVAVGHRGRVRGGAEMDTAFAHILRCRDGSISELVQITDTASWPVPVGV